MLQLYIMFFEELIPRQEKYRVVQILPEHFNALCQELRNELLEICYGKDMVSQDPGYYTYKFACLEIADMLITMPDDKKMGLIGELLMHLIVPKIFGTEVETLSRLLSMSERNIKHGFDLNYHDRVNNMIWYGEIKSGKNKSRKVLIKRAKNGLNDLFSGLTKQDKENTRKRWEAALNEITLIYCEQEQKRKDLTKLLSKSRQDITRNISRNALLMVVNFGETDVDFKTVSDIEQELDKIHNENTFDKCLIISARRELFDDILNFIISEGKDE